jgi:ribonucleoside-diphosphate reductase alpha chain
VKGEQYTVVVGLLRERPYEVFAGLSEHVEVPRKARKGVLVKNGKKDGVATYNLCIPVGEDDQMIIKDVVSMFDNPEHGALTRVISMSLRHGVPIHYVVEQLKKDRRSDLQSFSGGIARVLKGYIPDGTSPAAEKGCPQCGGNTLVYQQGCVGCIGGNMPDGTACGWSKC